MTDSDGEWLDVERFDADEVIIDEWQSMRCSKCDKYLTTPYMYFFNYFQYCPSCGAKMKGRTGQ